MAISAFKKSTNVRLVSAALRGAEWIAPGLAARWVMAQWFTLPRPPRPGARPDGGEPFSVQWEHGVVRGHCYGDGPVVYLLHGWGGRGDQLTAFVEPLRRAGYRAVVFDGPSHGTSDPGAHGPRSTTGLELAKALDAVFARFGPAEAVVAHSMGVLASLLALNDGWLGTERLVFVAPMSGYRSTMSGFQSMLGFGPRIRRRVDALTWKRVGLPPEAFELRALWARLPDPPPVLVVQDTADPQAPYAESRAIAEAIGAELVTTSGLGHNRILRDPAMIQRVVGFVRHESDLPATA